MEQQPENLTFTQKMDTAYARMDKASAGLESSVSDLLSTHDPKVAEQHAQAVHQNSAALASGILFGTAAVDKHEFIDSKYVQNPEIFEKKREADIANQQTKSFTRWNNKLTESINFTRTQSERVEDFGTKILDAALQQSLAYSRGAIDTATVAAMDSRNQSVLVMLQQDRMAQEYALNMAENNHIFDQPQPIEKGFVVATVPPKAVVARENGSLVAVEMPTSELRRMEKGEDTVLQRGDDGKYERVLKIERSQMESHTQDGSGTWHSLSFQVDHEGQARGNLVIQNKALELSEKHPLKFVERTGKDGELILSSKVSREGKPDLYVNIQPTGSADERGIKTVFAECVEGKFKSLDGKGGTLKPNKEMLAYAHRQQTAVYLKNKMDVDVIKIHERDMLKGKGVSKGLGG